MGLVVRRAMRFANPDRVSPKQLVVYIYSAGCVLLSNYNAYMVPSFCFNAYMVFAFFCCAHVAEIFLQVYVGYIHIKLLYFIKI